MNPGVAAIVLAAGASRRLGQAKQLLLYEGEPLLERAVRLALEAGAEPTLAVIGANHAAIESAINWRGSQRVINPEWETGIASSIHAGLNFLTCNAPRIAGSIILTCDQPRLTASHLRTLIETFAAQTAPAIVASSYAGIVGTPAIFPRSVFGDLFALRGDRGARALLLKPPCPLITVPFPGGEEDVDEPADLAQLG